MFKTSSKKVLLSLLISSFLMPAFATSPLESYIDQTINRQNNNADSPSVKTATTAEQLLAMDHYDRHAALTNMLETVEAGAAKNNPQDLFLLGYYYYSEAEDNSKEEDFHKAKEYFLQAEKLGSKDAIYLLGELYYYGEGVEQNYLTAAKYYEKAAALQQKNAVFSLGSLYLSGFGFDEDPAKAVEYYQKAAALQDITSINSLGYFYESGDNAAIEVDLTESAKWYQQSCDLGDSHGCDSVSRLKIHTLNFDSVLAEIVQKHAALKATRKLPLVSAFTTLDDYDRDIMLNDYLPEIIAASQKNNHEAIYLLGLYHQGQGDDSYDEYAYGQARILYEKAIDLGSTDAIYELAELYYYGNGVERDYEKSLTLYNDPKLDNHPEAVFSRAVQYDTGEGVEQNYETSFALFNKAAELGHTPSIFNIGYMYEYGEFVDKDLDEAKKWYQKACDNDYSDGCYAVNIIGNKASDNYSESNPELESLFNEIMGNELPPAELELTRDSILNADPSDARKYLTSQTDLLLEKVKNEQDVESLFLTGYLFYLEGLENSNDHTFAQSYALLEKAAEQGSEDALFYLGVMNFHGNSVETNYQQALEFFEKIDQEHPEALFYLATIYDEGLGSIAKDQEKSFALYNQAAALGHPDSTYNVGFMYHHGEFVTRDEVEAEKWYQKACELGDLDGCDQSARLRRYYQPEELAAESLDDTDFFEEENTEPQKERNPIEEGMENLFEGILEVFGPK